MTAERDENLLKFATSRQSEVIRKWWELGSIDKAAEALGVHRSTFGRALKSVKEKAARNGYAPGHWDAGVAPGYSMGKVTVHRTPKGVVQVWERQNPDAEKLLAALREAVDAMREEITPVRPVPFAARVKSQLLNCYVITDYHLGAMAWGEETGADWDLKIAEKLLVDWFAAAIDLAPDAHTGVFAQLGDFLHWDGLEAVTPTSKHVLDADSRFQKMVRVAIAVIRRIVAMLLEKHERVIVLMAEGNHDLASSAWLRELFAALYADEPRVEVITRPDPYYCVEWGSTSLFFHHGHKKKLANLETVFIAKFRDVFGRTRHSYAHTGHYHHDRVEETNTMRMEQHRTLAAPDSHASRGGWLSGRDAKVITYHQDFGRLVEQVVPEEMVRAAA